MDGRLGRQTKVPCDLQGFVPFGAAAQKRKKNMLYGYKKDTVTADCHLTDQTGGWMDRQTDTPQILQNFVPF